MFCLSECKCEMNVLLQSLLGLVGIECMTHSLERSEFYKIVIIELEMLWKSCKLKSKMSWRGFMYVLSSIPKLFRMHCKLP